jgi:hypothetical protein
MDYTDEIFNEALINIEDSCLLISGKHLNQWGLTLTDQIQNISHETEIIRETSYLQYIRFKCVHQC